MELTRATRRNGAPATRDPLVRQALAQFHVEIEMMKYTSYRVFSEILRGGDPRSEGSMLKLTWSELNQRMTEFAVALEGPAGQLVKGSAHAVQSGRWQHHFLRSRASTIEAGTSEIERIIIAERVLGMPRGR